MHYLLQHPTQLWHNILWSSDMDNFTWQTLARPYLYYLLNVFLRHICLWTFKKKFRTCFLVCWYANKLFAEDADALADCWLVEFASSQETRVRALLPSKWNAGRRSASSRLVFFFLKLEVEWTLCFGRIYASWAKHCWSCNIDFFCIGSYTRSSNKWTFIEALTSRRWISDMQGALSAGVIAAYLDPQASY